MLKRILLFVIVTGIIASCGNPGKKDISSKTDGSKTVDKVEFSALAANPENYIGKTIVIEGKVVHVCRETGKKMFIVGENPDVRLYIAAGENIPKFPMELLGSEVIVEGRITKAVGTASEKPENNLKGIHRSEGEVKTMSGDSCETETALAVQPSLADVIMEYKSHTLK
jgi:hypothetical protein